jgi:hypothetical protein
MDNGFFLDGAPPLAPPRLDFAPHYPLDFKTLLSDRRHGTGALPGAGAGVRGEGTSVPRTGVSNEGASRGAIASQEVPR